MGHRSWIIKLAVIGQRGVIGALLATTAVSGSMLAYGTAQAQSRYSIPAGPLGLTLNQFGSQSGTQISYDAAIVRGKSSPGVDGATSRQQALGRLLQGTGLDYSFTDPTSVMIFDPASQGAVTLGTITVESRNDGTTEGSGSYATSDSTIGKTAESLRETPQSVSVITSQQIRDRGMTTLGDALKNTTGITVVSDQYYSAGRFFSRGFEVNNLRIDGGAVGVTSNYDTISPVNLVKYDRVEVLRGADGLYSGNGEAGGVISLARKRPLDTFNATAELTAGSWHNLRSTFDVTGPLTDDARLRGRFVGSFDRGNTFYDGGKNRNYTLYGVIEADVTDHTTLLLGVTYDRRNAKPWTAGLPRYTDGQAIDFPVSTGLGTDWSYLHHQSWEVFGEVKHEFDSGAKWTTSATYTRHRYNAKYGYLAGAVDPVTGDGMVYNGSYNWSKGSQVQLDSHVDGRFDLFGRVHDFVVGVDYAKHASNVKRGEFTGPSVNLSDLGRVTWDEDDTPSFPGDYYFNFHPYGETRYGIYARGRFEVSDALHIVLGARYGSYDYTFHRASYNRDGSTNWTEALDYSETGVFTPFAAITYDLSDKWTAYASYADIYQSQARYLKGPEPGAPLDPITGRTFEAGLKGEPTAGVNTSIAIYHTTRKGEAVYDPIFGGVYNPDNGSSCCYTASGKVVSQGIDLEISGEVATGLQAFAGYTLNLNKNKNTDTIYSTITPKHLAKVWTTYNPAGDYAAWTWGAGLRVQSATTVSGEESIADGAGGSVVVPFKFIQSGYAVADLSVKYDFSDRTSLTLNVNNVFDRKYYGQLGTLAKNNVYGEPRNVMVTLRTTF